jgi:hypothetical protein
MNDAKYLLYGMLAELPSLLTTLICVLVAAIRWRRHPSVSLLLILSLIWLAVQSLLFDAVTFFTPQWYVEHGAGASYETFYVAAGLCNNILGAIAFALLLTAIFSRRGTARAGAAGS